MNENWQANLLWELLESEAPEKFYVNGKEMPAFLLFHKYHWASQNKKYTLYLNRVGVIAEFTSQKKALERLKLIVENANFPVRVHRLSRTGRYKDKRILFAENTVERIDRETLRGPCKVFNIDEWQEVKLAPA